MTLDFLKLVPSPFARVSDEYEIDDINHMYYFARKNRLPLMCLESLRNIGRLQSLEKEYGELTLKYEKTIGLFEKVARVLDKSGVAYAFFKSTRPYHEVTVDIDILIFGQGYKEAVLAFCNSGYQLRGVGPLSTTFRDKETRINLDVYSEVGVSHIVYLDKDVLEGFTATRSLNGVALQCLDMKTDLVAVIAHSVLKEQLYVLSEYYTTLYYLADMKWEDSPLISLITACKIRWAARIHFGITALLHRLAYGNIPVRLVKILEGLGVDAYELNRVFDSGLSFPHKYHPLSIGRVLFEKFREKKARRSLAFMAFSSLDPGFSSQVFKDGIKHIFRDTY